MYIFHTFYRDVTVNHCKTLLHAFQCTLGTALKYKQYSGITLETETHVKCVKITLNIFAVWLLLYGVIGYTKTFNNSHQTQKCLKFLILFINRSCDTSPQRIRLVMEKTIFYNMAMGLRQCLPFSQTTIRGIYCKNPIAVMGVVYTFRQGFHLVNCPKTYL